MNDRRQNRQRTKSTNVAGVTPPMASRSEQALLGTLIVHPQRAADVAAMLPLDDFADPNARVCLEALCELAAGGACETNPVVLQSTIERLTAERTGGDRPAGVEQWLLDIVQNAEVQESLVDEYVASIRSAAKRRRMIAMSQQIAAEGYVDKRDTDAWANESVQRLADVADVGAAASKVKTGKDVVKQMMERYTNPEVGWALHTGLPDLDALMLGMRGGEYVVIGAWSGVGKTTFAMALAWNALANDVMGSPVGVAWFGLEMKADELFEKWACAIAEIDARKLSPDWKGLKLTDEEGRAYLRALEWLHTDRIVIDDRGFQTPASIRASVRAIHARLKRQGTPLRMVVIDYVQLVSGDKSTGRTEQNREQEVAAVSRSFKALAMELDIVVVVCAQLNEEGRKDKRLPRASDLRESKAIHHDANAVILVHNEAMMVRSESYSNGDKVNLSMDTVDDIDLIVAKRRKGRPGRVRAEYWPVVQRFAPWDGDVATLESPKFEQGKPPRRRAA